MHKLAEVSAALSAGEEHSEQLVEAALTRATDPAGEGARVFVHLYADRARAAARASDLLIGAGWARSPLEGVPISIKDLFDVAGSPTSAGSRLRMQSAPATEHALIVKRLLAAGAVIVGRTNMTEFAYSGLGLNPHFGTPANPWDRATRRIPGGSSSGAPVSVADGMAVAAIGSDTGGSIRVPAALCGLTGFKSSTGRVVKRGTFPLSPTLDSIGPIAPSVACCALLDAVLAGEDPDQVPGMADLRGKRFLVPTSVVQNDLDATVAAAFAQALRRVRAAGAVLEERAIPELDELAVLNAQGGILAAEAYVTHRQHLSEYQGRIDARVHKRLLRGAAISAAEHIELMDARVDWIARVKHRLGTCEALLYPTCPVVAPPITALEQDDDLFHVTNLLILRNPSIINFLDGCALSLPCHAPGSAPVGLAVAAPHGHDRNVLALGQAIEAALLAA